MNTDEIWATIPGFDGRYEASSFGRVRNAKTGRILRPWLAGTMGYEYLSLGRDWKGAVHRLVCLAFHGKPEGRRTDVAHFDGQVRNNRPDNLRWATRGENTADAVRHGTSKLNQYRSDGYKPRRNPNPRRGVDSPSAKLDPTKAAEIREQYQSGATMRAIARKYDVGPSTVCRVVHGSVWA